MSPRGAGTPWGGNQPRKRPPDWRPPAVRDAKALQRRARVDRRKPDEKAEWWREVDRQIALRKAQGSSPGA
jgi:hypothetical protein